MGQLPREVIREDHKLEEATTKSAELLMELRWHWTLDESNPDRVSISEYARAVGRHHSNISRDVRGYELVRAGTGASEARERAKMGAETEAATEAVAGARGTGLQQARKTRPVEVRRVREIARQRAEDKGTSVEEEAPRVADWIVKAEKAETKRTEDRREKLGLRFVEMEGLLTKAKQPLLDALRLAREIEWDDEARELLEGSLANVKSLLGLIDMALSGAAEVDWDAELQKLTEVER